MERGSGQHGGGAAERGHGRAQRREGRPQRPRGHLVGSGQREVAVGGAAPSFPSVFCFASPSASPENAALPIRSSGFWS